ncbi:hypothetical protein [Polaromonas sp.]|uniref:hypothetical protein n=1 Tax=Polaromonas sp. TaxID=1869339 RepID=UPI003262D33D
MLDAPLDDLRATLLPASAPRPRLYDGFAYAGLVLISLAWTLAPLAAVCGWILFL